MTSSSLEDSGWERHPGIRIRWVLGTEGEKKQGEIWGTLPWVSVIKVSLEGGGGPIMSIATDRSDNSTLSYCRVFKISRTLLLNKLVQRFRIDWCIWNYCTKEHCCSDQYKELWWENREEGGGSERQMVDEKAAVNFWSRRAEDQEGLTECAMWRLYSETEASWTPW